MVTTQYPTALPTTNQCPTSLTDNVTDVLAVHQNAPHAEIIAIATELGLLPKGTYATIKARLDDLNDKIAGSPVTLNMITDEPDTVIHGEWTTLVNSNYAYCGFFYNSSNADTNSFSVKFRCAAGTYKLRITMPKDSDECKVDIFVDANKVGDQINLYSAARVGANVEEFSGLSLGGEHTLKFTVNGKDGASSGHFCPISQVSLMRTA
jgi:hypothetical protein